MLVSVPTGALGSHYNLTDIDLVPPKDVRKLATEGIRTTEQLFGRLKTRSSRDGLSHKLGIKVELLADWAHRCDLLRVKGLGPTSVELMVRAGVSSIESLRKQKPASLLIQLTSTNAKHHITQKLPDEKLLDNWIKQAQRLEILLEP